jgi:predicted RNase H-like HicB family nuclease
MRRPRQRRRVSGRTLLELPAPGNPKPLRPMGAGLERAVVARPTQACLGYTCLTEGVTLMRYAVVIEKANGNYSAYVPDLPGCVATGDTVSAVEQEIREAIRFHIDGLKTDGLPVPQPTSLAEYIEA